MATTDQKRIWYPEVVTNHKDRGKKGYKPKCDTSKATRVPFPREGGGEYNLLVHPKTVEAWNAYTTVMRWHGETIPPAGGTHNCRNIANSNWPSLHAYCLACDHPPNNRMKQAFIDDVLRIRTKNGKRVFKNLASANDRMHNEIDCSPADLKTGIDWSTVRGYTPGPTPKPPSDWTEELIMALPMLREGDGYKAQNPGLRNDVRRMQACLAIGGVMATNTFDPKTGMPDGYFGPGTLKAVKDYQKKNGLSVDGIVGRKTWTKLLGQ